AQKSGQRTAEKELTDRNWDQEDEAEGVGTCSVVHGGTFKGFKGLVVLSGGGVFLDLDCQMEIAVTSAPSFTSPKAENEATFRSITTSNGKRKISNPKTNGDSQ
ncbi:hypothetical protein HPG69_014762, partial [Diceros bicornis minor]